MKNTFLVLLVLFFTLFSCKKNVILKQLPPETKTGANTFGCLINGDLYATEGKLPAYKEPLKEGGVSYNLDSAVLEIKAAISLVTNQGQIIWLNIQDFDSTAKVYKNFTMNNLTPDTTYDNFVKIDKFDNQAISGTFQTKVKRFNGTIWEVTSGRFDIAR